MRRRDGIRKGLFFLLLLAVVCIPAFGDTLQAAGKDGKLNAEYVVLAVGNKFQLKYKGSRKIRSWTRSNGARAVVTKKGLVTGTAKGKVVIRAKFRNGGGLACTFIMRPKAKTEAAKNGGGSWKTDHGAVYYIFPDGSMLTGCCPVGSEYYLFDENGKLRKPAKKAVLKAGKKSYIVSPTGRVQTGWQMVGNNLYYANPKGVVLKNRTVQNVPLGKNGAATASEYTAWQKKVTEVVEDICSEDMSKSEKLRACWNFIVSRNNFSYYLRDIVEGSKDWQKRAAYIMLTTRQGDCNNFACAFAAMANCIGYDAYVIYGRVSGTRDRAPDGLTRHAWVTINGLYYDPEAQFAGWYRNVYGNSSYDIRHQTIASYLYRK